MSKLIGAHILQALQQRIEQQRGNKSHSFMVITAGTAQRTETTRDKYADMSDKQVVNVAASCSSQVMATLEDEKRDNRLRQKSRGGKKKTCLKRTNTKFFKTNTKQRYPVFG